MVYLPISIYLKKSKYLNILNPRQFLSYKKGADHFMNSSRDGQPCFYIFFAMQQILEIKDDFQVVSQFPCLLGHPVDRHRLQLKDMHHTIS